MRMLRVAAAIVLLLLVVPEFARYAAERRLRRVTTAAAMLRTARGGVEQRERELRGLSETARGIHTWPGDWRPLEAAASASLFGKDPAGAIRLYRRCLALGERPDVVYDLGVAFANVRDAARADAAFLRAAWLSPAIAGQLDARAPTAYMKRTDAIEQRLESGTLAARDLPSLP